MRPDAAGMVSFTVEGPLVGKERPRRGRGGHFYTPRKTLEAEARIRAACLAAMASGQTCTGTQVRVRCLVHGKRRPDIDNLLKTLLDGLQGAAFANDQIVTMVRIAIVSDDPGPTRWDVEVW